MSLGEIIGSLLALGFGAGCVRVVRGRAEADNDDFSQIPTEDDTRHRHHLLYDCHQRSGCEVTAKLTGGAIPWEARQLAFSSVILWIIIQRASSESNHVQPGLFIKCITRLLLPCWGGIIYHCSHPERRAASLPRPNPMLMYAPMVGKAKFFSKVPFVSHDAALPVRLFPFCMMMMMLFGLFVFLLCFFLHPRSFIGLVDLQRHGLAPRSFLGASVRLRRERAQFVSAHTIGQSCEGSAQPCLARRTARSASAARLGGFGASSRCRERVVGPIVEHTQLAPSSGRYCVGEMLDRGRLNSESRWGHTAVASISEGYTSWAFTSHAGPATPFSNAGAVEACARQSIFVTRSWSAEDITANARVRFGAVAGVRVCIRRRGISVDCHRLAVHCRRFAFDWDDLVEEEIGRVSSKPILNRDKGGSFPCYIIEPYPSVLTLSTRVRAAYQRYVVS